MVKSIDSKGARATGGMAAGSEFREGCSMSRKGPQRIMQKGWADCKAPLHRYLLKGALVLHTLGPHEHPAVPEGHILDVLAAQITEKLPGLFIHPAAQKEEM